MLRHNEPPVASTEGTRIDEQPHSRFRRVTSWSAPESTACRRRGISRWSSRRAARGSGRRHRRPRQDRARRRRVGHRLRLRAQPVHDRADPRDPAAFGRRVDVRPGRVRLSAGRVRVGGRGESGVRLRAMLHASQARVGYPSDLYQGRDAKQFPRSGSGPTSRPTASTSSCTRR